MRRVTHRQEQDVAPNIVIHVLEDSTLMASLEQHVSAPTSEHQPALAFGGR
jgi:hypothetical protein